MAGPAESWVCGVRRWLRNAHLLSYTSYENYDFRFLAIQLRRDGGPAFAGRASRKLDFQIPACDSKKRPSLLNLYPKDNDSRPPSVQRLSDGVSAPADRIGLGLDFRIPAGDSETLLGDCNSSIRKENAAPEAATT